MQFDIRLGHVSDQSELGDYYLDLSHTIDPVASGFYGPIDEKGIPLVDYDKLFRHSPIKAKKDNYGIHYTPVTIAQYGLGLYSNHLKRPDDQSYRLFLAQADWHVANLVSAAGGWGVWLHNFEFPLYNLSSPWVSAMAQGQGISLLLRAYQESGEQRYLEAARLAFQAFRHDLLDGGVARRDQAGDVWLEEYPTDPACHVLNGFIFAIWGVLDFFRCTGDPEAGELYRQCSATLKANILRYQGFYWSKYHVLTADNVSLDYHLIHVLQLQVMAELNGDMVLAETARRWDSYAGGKCKAVRFMFRIGRGVMRRALLCSSNGLRGVAFDASAKVPA